jgi:outer membrane protein assembly factor BamB
MWGHDSQVTGRSNYVAAQDATIKCTYDTGVEGWRASPVISADGTIYIAGRGLNHTRDYRGALLALNPEGTLKWMYEPGDGLGVSLSSPAIGPDGTIYIGFDCYDCDEYNGYLYAINPDGSFKWRCQTNEARCYSVPQVSIPIVGMDGTIFVVAHNKGDNKALVAVNPDGTVKWRSTAATNFWSVPSVGYDGTIYIEGYAINPDGSVKWLNEMHHPECYSAVGSDGTVYIANTIYGLRAINPDGTLKWETDHLNSYFRQPAIGANGNIIVCGGCSPGLVSINQAGETMWSFNIRGISPAIGDDGTIYIADNAGDFYALTSDGELKWKEYLGGRTSGVLSSPAIGSDGTVYVISQLGVLYAFGENTSSN